MDIIERIRQAAAERDGDGVGNGNGNGDGNGDGDGNGRPYGRTTNGELARRREVCAGCPERREDGGRLLCNLCKVCGGKEPWLVRSRCPVFRWGRDADRMRAEAQAQPTPAPVLLSAIMPAREEGGEVRATCESFLAAGVDEIILVDDGSTDGSCSPNALRGLPAFWEADSRVNGAEFGDEPLPRILVVRNDGPLGVGRARNQGAARASGDVLLFADAHERAETGLRRFAEAALEKDAILCAAVKPLRSGSTEIGRRDWTGYGADFGMDKDGAAYKDKWLLRRPKGRFGPINALIGACYAVPRGVFERIGGWVATRHWGYNEQAISMKAWFCGVPLFVDAETVIRHQFKRRFKYPCSASGSQLNRWHVHAVIFDEGVFDGFWAPRFAKAYGRKVEAQARALLSEDAVRAEIADFHKRKVRSDAEWFAAFPS